MMYQQQGQKQFENFFAKELYCVNCHKAMPVLERLLLILPNGYLYKYYCERCGAVLGDRKVSLSTKDKLMF